MGTKKENDKLTSGWYGKPSQRFGFRTAQALGFEVPHEY